MQKNLIILAGGASSRMKKHISTVGLSSSEIDEANTKSKSLISVGPGDRPLLDYLLKNAEVSGYTDVFLVVGKDSASFKLLYGEKDQNNAFRSLRISYAIQAIPEGRVKPLGTADALWQALEQYPSLKEQHFTVCNSDNLYSTKALEAIRTVSNDNAFIAYDRDSLDFTTDRIKRFALLKMSADMALRDIVEKPNEEDIENCKDTFGKLRVSMNLFRFNGKMIYDYLKNCPLNEERQEKELPTAVKNMCLDYPGSIVGIPFSEHVPDLTSKNDILEVKQYLKHEI